MFFRSQAVRVAVSALLLSASVSQLSAQARPSRRPAAGEPKMPKLVVGVMVDQFRYDYLNRFQKEFTGGFARFLKQGAVFTNAHYEHFPTVTAIGHSTFMSGATPSVSGIIGNSWWEKETQKTVTSVLDEKTDLVGALGAGASPRRLLVSTLPDELKISGKGGKSFGISIKDRSAILPAGHMANGAFWFDAQSGTFVSSTYYSANLPAWVTAFNEEKLADKYIATEWMTLADPSKAFKKPVRSPGAKYAELDYTPYANELIEGLAERAIDAEKLGQGDKTDFLSVSFSANDYVGHAMGPDSDEVHDISILTDRLLEKFFQYLDKKVGLANCVIVMSADHGVAPLVEVNQARKMPGKRLVAADQNKALDEALTAKFGKGKWITNRAEYGITLNREVIASKKLEVAEVTEFAAGVMRGFEGIQRVFTHDQLLRGQVPHDRFHNRVINGFFPQRAADIYVVHYPYFLYDKTGTTHGVPFNYDTHVPVMFLGMGIRPGRYHQQIAVNDIAPTLATMLGIEIPTGAYGRVLEEIMTPSVPAAGTR